MDSDLNLTPRSHQPSPALPTPLHWPHSQPGPPVDTSPTLEQMRRFRRVHTTTSLSGCLGGVGEERGLLSQATQPLYLLPSLPSTHIPLPQERHGRPFIWGHKEQGGAAEVGWGPGQKGKGLMWVSKGYKADTDRDIQRDRHTYRQRDAEKHTRTLKETHRERHTWSKRSPFTHKYLWSVYHKPSPVWGQSRAKGKQDPSGAEESRGGTVPIKKENNKLTSGSGREPLGSP